jgi:glycolate oxidase FAD binding subunit
VLRPRLLEDAQEALGRDAVRASRQEDIVEGLQPQIAVSPADAKGVGAALAWASREKLGVVVRGGGTRLDWGPPPHRYDILLSTARLNAVVAHRHGDLTATLQAGATLADVNRALARHDQWLPLDPSDADQVTIGGLVATNDSGPRRHRYGSPRDLIIGIEIARADGRLAKGGGIVVKNVAGYDLPRLFTGSFGSLGVIVAATFKLFPLPHASRTVVAEFRDADGAAALAATLRQSQLTPSAIEIAGPPFVLLVRFESVEAALDTQAAETRRLARAAHASTYDLSGPEEQELWNAHTAQPGAASRAVIRLNLLPADLGPALEWLGETLPNGSWQLSGRAGLGAYHLSVDDTPDAQARFVNDLREHLPDGRGSAVLLRGSPELKRLVDVWGPIGDAAPLMRVVKRQFDPAGILNAGRGPGGL